MLRWEAFPGATAYRVRLWNDEGEQIIDHQLAPGPSPLYRIELPEAAADQIMLWQVEALEEGRVLASAGPMEFHWRAR